MSVKVSSAFVLCLASTPFLSGCMSALCDDSASGDRLDAAYGTAACLATMSPTSPSQMPTNGSGTYVGYMTADIEVGSASDVILGNAALNANFKTGSLTGGVSALSSGDYGDMSGSFIIDGNISGNGFTAGLTSVSVDYNGATLTLSGGQSSGKFYGDKADGLLGDVSGTVTISGTGTGSISGYIFALQ